MASSDSMDDDTFSARVQKAFGSLSSSHSSLLRPPWSLTDDEVEKREWLRERTGSNRDDDRTSCSFAFDGLFSKDRRNSRNTRRELQGDREDLNEDDKDGHLSGGAKRGDGDDRDEWEIRSSIGLDCNLDNEEEEDEYDKVAEGRDNDGDRLYMSDVTDHGPYLNSHNALPSLVCNASRDPRANHSAARVRLKEDEVEGQKFGSDHSSDISMSNVEEPCIKASEDGGKLKSIFKRKNDAAYSKAQKRVRLDPDFKDECGGGSGKPEDFMTSSPSRDTRVSDDNSLLARNTPGVPDYVLNPSKYTCYSFGSSCEVDDESNSQVCMDFLKMAKRSKPKESGSQSGDASSHLPKQVTFIPRKKASCGRQMDNSSEGKQNQDDGCKQSLTGTGFPLSNAAGETQRSKVSVTEDELETNETDMSTDFQTPCRHYRTRPKLDDPVS